MQNVLLQPESCDYCWKLLPREVVDASSLEVFNKRQDKFMDSSELGNKS